LTSELSVEEPVSSIRMGSYSEGFIGLEVLCEAIRKDFLVGFAVGFVVEDLGSEGESEGFDLMDKNLRTRGRSVRPTVVLILLFLIPSSG